MCSFNANVVNKDDGGAIYSKNNLTVKHSIFEENIGKCGGAVIMAGKNNNIQNSNFENNQAIKDSEGGAVYICKDTEASINYCNFIENTAMHGSAFYIRKYSTVDLSHNYWQSNGQIITNPFLLMDVSTKAIVRWEPVLTQPIIFKSL